MLLCSDEFAFAACCLCLSALYSYLRPVKGAELLCSSYNGSSDSSNEYPKMATCNAEVFSFYPTYSLSPLQKSVCVCVAFLLKMLLTKTLSSWCHITSQCRLALVILGIVVTSHNNKHKNSNNIGGKKSIMKQQLQIYGLNKLRNWLKCGQEDL